MASRRLSPDELKNLEVEDLPKFIENDLRKLTEKKSIVQTVIRRELGQLGNFYTLDRFNNVIERQLIKARQQSVNINVKTHQTRSSNDDYNTVMEVKTPNSLNTLVIILDDKIFIRRHQKNEPYHCVQLDKHIKLPRRTPIDSLYKYEKYKIAAVERWVSWELFYPSTVNPNPIVFKKRIPATLFILEKDSPNLKLYDFDSGSLLQTLLIDPSIKFTQIDRCSYESSKFLLQSVKATWPKDVLSDFIVLDYPPLEIYSRCQVFTSAFPKANKLEVTEQLVFVMYPNHSIEIFDLQEMFKTTAKIDSSGNGNGIENSTSIGITHVVRTKMPALIKVEKCFFGLLTIDSGSNPPWCISKTKDDIFRVFSTSGDEIGNSESVNFLNLNGEDRSLSVLEFHSDNSGRLILSGRNEIKIMRITRSKENSKLELVPEFERSFDVLGSSIGEQVSSSSTNTGNRRSSRKRKIINCYDEEDVQIKCKYETNMDALGIMIIAQNTLQFFLLDNQKYYTIAIIEPFHFGLPNFRDQTFRLPLNEFHFHETFISVRLGDTQEDTENVFLLDMFGEADDLKIQQPKKVQLG